MSRNKAPGYMTEDLAPRITGGPPRYTSRTEKPVEYVPVADNGGAIVGYLYVCDADGAAGWQARVSATPEQQNLAAAWMRLLHRGKARGVKPGEALEELLRNPANGQSRVAAESRRVAESLAALRVIAGWPAEP
jgi:hypothetical protein